MVSPSKRGAKKTMRPGGKRIYKSKKPGRANCALCGSKLHGVPKKSFSQLGKLSKTQKRPERPFGGVLCASCTARVVKAEARLKHSLATRSDLDYSLLKFVRA